MRDSFEPAPSVRASFVECRRSPTRAPIGTIAVAVASSGAANSFTVGTHRARLLAIFSVSMWALLVLAVGVTFVTVHVKSWVAEAPCESVAMMVTE